MICDKGVDHAAGACPFHDALFQSQSVNQTLSLLARIEALEKRLDELERKP